MFCVTLACAWVINQGNKNRKTHTTGGVQLPVQRVFFFPGNIAARQFDGCDLGLNRMIENGHHPAHGGWGNIYTYKATTSNGPGGQSEEAKSIGPCSVKETHAVLFNSPIKRLTPGKCSC